MQTGRASTAQYPLLYCILCYLKTVLVIILQSCFHVNINNNGIFIKLIFCTTGTSLAETKNTLSSAWALSTHFSSSTKKLMFLSRCWFFTCIKENKKDTCTVTKLWLNSQTLAQKWHHGVIGWFQKISIPYHGWHEYFNPPLALRIPKSLTPPLLRNFPLLFQTLWNSCSSA